MAAENGSKIRIAPVETGSLEAMLPLIEDYQRFYEVRRIERGHNRGFFGRLIAPSQHGALVGAWDSGEPVAYACVHWTLDSVQARETASLHDLYVRTAHRGAGIGRGLIAAAADLARARGASALLWDTTPDSSAQRIYDSLGAERSSWLRYELSL